MIENNGFDCSDYGRHSWQSHPAKGTIINALAFTRIGDRLGTPGDAGIGSKVDGTQRLVVFRLLLGLDHY